jgi:predicted nucleic-acid-binding Zn-ribbon protein
MASQRISPCPNCDGRDLYRSREVSAGGGHSPNFLPGLLGRFWRAERFRLVVCHDCGLTRFFARREATEQLPSSKKWERC